MAIRNYVGARYVPKFADPVEWQANTSYEAMVIVTYNNSSYTSKVPVPPTVGNPAENSSYWVLTGNYNAQVEEYRQNTLQVQEKVNKNTNDIDIIKNETAKINTSINTVNTINDLKKSTLPAGCVVKTLGYYTLNDNGGGLYVIKKEKPEHANIILDSGLYAELVTNNPFVNSMQYGVNNTTPDYIKTLDNFELNLEGNFYDVGTGAYGEAITYNMNNNSFYLAAYGSNVPKHTIISNIDKNGNIIKQNSIEFPSAPNCLGFIGKTNTILVSEANGHILTVNGTTLEVTGELTVPSAVNGWYVDYDNINNEYAFFMINDNNAYFKTYNDNFELIKEYQYNVPELRGQNERQGFTVGYDKFFTATWTGLYEFDKVTGNVNINKYNSPLEIEDECFADGTLYLFSHFIYLNGYDFIFKYNKKIDNITKSMKYYTKTPKDYNNFDLNFISTTGIYNVYNSTNNELHYPIDCTEGLLIVTTNTTTNPKEFTNSRQIFYDKNSNAIYIRKLHDARNWYDWHAIITDEDIIKKEFKVPYNIPANKVFHTSLKNAGIEAPKGYKMMGIVSTFLDGPAVIIINASVFNKGDYAIQLENNTDNEVTGNAYFDVLLIKTNS